MSNQKKLNPAAARESRLKRRLKKINVRHYAQLIHDQPKEWLVKNFSHRADEYPVNISLLFRNLIWQLRERIVSGQKPPLNELIRTFWYMYVKPTLSRVESLSVRPDNQYKILIAQMADMVTKHNLMRYKDIGFRDDRRAYRKVGENPTVILFAEKAGYYEFLTESTKKYKISALALGGKPSILNNEYFVDTLKEEGVDIRRSFYIFSIVDFDPHGQIVKDSFIRNLKFYGVKNIKVIDLIHPDILTADEVRASRYRLSHRRKRDIALNERWLKQVQKKHYKNMKYLIDRPTLYGLHSEAVSLKRLSEKIKELVLPILGKGEDYLRHYELQNLIEALDRLIVHQARKRRRR